MTYWRWPDITARWISSSGWRKLILPTTMFSSPMAAPCGRMSGKVVQLTFLVPASGMMLLIFSAAPWNSGLPQIDSSMPTFFALPALSWRKRCSPGSGLAVGCLAPGSIGDMVACDDDNVMPSMLGEMEGKPYHRQSCILAALHRDRQAVPHVLLRNVLKSNVSISVNFPLKSLCPFCLETLGTAGAPGRNRTCGTRIRNYNSA